MTSSRCTFTTKTEQHEAAKPMKRFAILTALLLLAAAPAAFAASADEMRALLNRGDAAAAYALGKKNPEQLGRPAFDFFFGIAAIDSGHAGEGVLALERYVSHFPDSQQARLELARGYFILGENQRAREEFTGVLNTRPPAAVAANAERYLDAIRARESRYRTTSGAYIEVGFGYDSNINSGVTNSSINLPIFGAVNVNESGVRMDRRFLQTTAGANLSVPLAPGIAMFGSISGDIKSHEANKEFDQTNVGAGGGLRIIDEKNVYHLSAGYSSLGVDYRNFRDVAALGAEVSRQLDEVQLVSTSLQYATLTHAGSNAVRDSVIKGAGLGYRLALIGPWRPALSLNANYSVEDNRRGRDDLARDIYALRGIIAVSPAPRWAFSGGIGVQFSNYEAPDALLQTTRRDQYFGIDFSASYAIKRNLTVRGEVTTTKNHSNVELYKFRRDLAAIKVRYETK